MFPEIVVLASFLKKQGKYCSKFHADGIGLVPGVKTDLPVGSKAVHTMMDRAGQAVIFPKADERLPGSIIHGPTIWFYNFWYYV